LNGRHTGRTDLPLTPHGEQAAAALRPSLSAIKFAAVYSSPLQRARRTAQIAGFPDPEVTPLLQEFDYGDYEGLTSAQIHERQPDWQLYRDGCPGGESPEQVYNRARAFIDIAAASAGPAIAFAHGHILRAVAIAWMALDIIAAARLDLDVATLSILADDQHGRVLKLWNAPP
jgi:broad specificity phosphatase PhoE